MKFKDYVLEEGDLLDAVKHGFSAGFKAFRQKREQQAKKNEAKTLKDKIMSAEGKELTVLIRNMVEKDMDITAQCGKVEKSTEWLKECTGTKTERCSARSGKTIFQTYLNSRAKAGGALTAPA